jgi:hypothetical protein
MALAVVTIINNGVCPPLLTALAANIPQQGWVILPALAESVESLSAHLPEKPPKPW